MFGEAADDETFNELGKIWKIRNGTVGTGLVRINVDFLSNGSTRVCLSCSNERLQRRRVAEMKYDELR